MRSCYIMLQFFVTFRPVKLSGARDASEMSASPEKKYGGGGGGGRGRSPSGSRSPPRHRSRSPAQTESMIISNEDAAFVLGKVRRSSSSRVREP